MSQTPNFDDHQSRESLPDVAPFITDHLGVAAFLVANGQVPTITASSGRCWFRFATTRTINELVGALDEGRARVAPMEYDAARIRLRKAMDDVLVGEEGGDHAF